MNLAFYKLVILTVGVSLALAASPKFDYGDCIDECVKAFKWQTIHYVCASTEYGPKSYGSRCYYNCGNKLNKNRYPEIECQGFEGCYNNCTDEEKYFVNQSNDMWCSKVNQEEVMFLTKCWLKCRLIIDYKIEKDHEMYSCQKEQKNEEE